MARRKIRWTTTGRLLALTAAVALCFWGYVLMKRRAYFLEKASRYVSREWLYGNRTNIRLPNGKWMLNEEVFGPDGYMKAEFIPELDRKHERYARILNKYRYAANHPWVSVEEEPGEESP